MRRILLLFALLLFTATPAFAQSSNDAHVTQIDTSVYPEVTVYVRVTGTNGQPVAGLAQRDFKITEDGQPITISRFSGGGASAVSTVLVIDHSGSMEENAKLDNAREAARAFVRQMRPGDTTALIAFNSESDLLQGFTGNTSDFDKPLRLLDHEGGTAIYDSMVQAVDLLKTTSGRRALLLLTDGQDCREPNECPDEYGSKRTLQESIAYANKYNQPVYVIGLGNRSSDGRDGIDETVLQRIARETSGEYFYAPTGERLADLYRTLSSSMQQEYALTYRSPRPFYDGTRRDIQVRVGETEATGGSYLQQHLINVRSDFGVGMLLLLPILVALVLPGFLAGRKRTIVEQALPLETQPAEALPVADGATILQVAARCSTCDAALVAGALFCDQCGTTAGQSGSAKTGVSQRIFCEECGRPLRANSQFCSACGAPQKRTARSS